MSSGAYLTPREFASIVRLTVSAVQRLCRNGRLVAQKTPGGGRWRILSSELQRWQLGFGREKDCEVRHD